MKNMFQNILADSFWKLESDNLVKGVFTVLNLVRVKEKSIN